MFQPLGLPREVGSSHQDLGFLELELLLRGGGSLWGCSQWEAFLDDGFLPFQKWCVLCFTCKQLESKIYFHRLKKF